MESNLPKKYDDSLFNRIKKAFLKIFGKNIVKPQGVIQRTEDKKCSKKDDFYDMKLLSDKAKIKEDILNIIESKPEIIEKLSTERLRELKKMYEVIIEENDRIIKKLKRKVS